MDVTKKISAVLKCLANHENVLVDCSPFEIGRSRTASLIIPSLNISRTHCQLKLIKNQTWILQDLSSSGTFVNDELVGSGKSKIIKNKDKIRLGPSECNLVWQFKTNVEMGMNSSNKCDNIDFQSQTIAEICTKKNALQRRIIQNRESNLKMKIEKEKLHRSCASQVQALMDGYSSNWKKVENQSGEIKSNIDKLIETEKKKIQNEMEQKLKGLQEKINENNNLEEQLKLEIQTLQEKLGSEQLQWENKFLEEKRKLEEKIEEQNKKLAAEKVKMEEMSLIRGRELQDKLKKEEEEKRLLMEKLKEMEEVKELLSQKLKESDELHLKERARLEEELIKKEENVKALVQEKMDSLQKNQIESHDQLKAEMEEEKHTNNQDLLSELDRVKDTLIQTESRQKLLEEELAQANTLQDEASKVKLNVLENIADLMETELQCSVCSELFVTAVTLNCMHTFCKHCIDTWKKKRKNCPICRNKITSENRSIVMDNYIDKMVETLSEEFKSRRMAVIADRNSALPPKKPRVTHSISGSSRNVPASNAVRRGNRMTSVTLNQSRRQTTNTLSLKEMQYLN